jgi:1-acyl-sn-glycerol-3-phosphate acyltransferase
MIRSVWTFAWGGLVTLWYSAKVTLLSLTRRESLQCGRCDEIARAWGSGILWAAGVRVTVEGGESLSADRAQIVVGNHESWFDVFALISHAPTSLRFVAKKELEGIPLFGRAWKSCGHVSVDRSDRAAAIESLELASRQIRDRDLSIMMFPEGTRSKSGDLQRFKKGAFVLAIKAGVPIVPVAVIGSRPIMPKGSYRVRSGEIVIRVGEPIPVDGLSHEDRDALALRARAAVAELRGGEGPTSRLPTETLN